MEEDITGQPSTSAATISPTSRPLFTGRPRQSPVWQHFEYDASTCKSICQVPVQGDRVCSAEFSGKFTTNLKAHLKGADPMVSRCVRTVFVCGWLCVWSLEQNLWIFITGVHI